MSDEEARARIFAGDQPGLLVDDMDWLSKWQRPFAQPRAAVAGWTLRKPGEIRLMDAMLNAKPTVLIGVTAQTGLFSGEVLSTMASVREAADRPGALEPDEQVRVHAGRGGEGHQRHGPHGGGQPVPGRSPGATASW